MKSKRTRITAFVLLSLAAVVVIYIFASLGISKYGLITTEYTLRKSGVSEDISIVVLSDLHDSSFGKDNRRLVEKVKDCNPDLIFTVGDMVSDYTEDYFYLSSLYSSLTEIAPTYCSLGNHEQNHPESEKITEILRKNSTAILDNRYIEISVKGTEIRLGGLMGYHPKKESLNAFVRDFSDTDKFTLLMTHCPEYYIWGVDEVKTDLMISGHTHGGQVILPFKGGLFAPEQGYFPYFDYGVFNEENTTMVITRGLGTSKQILPRFNNIPEVLHLTLSPEVDYEH